MSTRFADMYKVCRKTKTLGITRAKTRKCQKDVDAFLKKIGDRHPRNNAKYIKLLADCSKGLKSEKECWKVFQLETQEYRSLCKEAERAINLTYKKTGILPKSVKRYTAKLRGVMKSKSKRNGIKELRKWQKKECRDRPTIKSPPGSTELCVRLLKK